MRSFRLPCTILNILSSIIIYYCFNPRGILYTCTKISPLGLDKCSNVICLISVNNYFTRCERGAVSKRMRKASILKSFNNCFQIQLQNYLKLLNFITSLHYWKILYRENKIIPNSFCGISSFLWPKISSIFNILNLSL